MVLTGLSKLITVKVLPRIPAAAFGISSRLLSLFQPQRLILMADTTQAAAAAQTASPASSSSTSAVNRNRCIFCKIVDGEDKASSDKILFRDDEFIVLPDIRPAAKHHLLVVTKEHIRDAKSLSPSQIELLDRQVQTAQKVLADILNKESDGAEPSTSTEKILMGFHWPPFHTVSHLHLHIIWPSDQIGFIGRIIFRPNSYWFVQPDWVRSRLEKLQDKGTS